MSDYPFALGGYRRPPTSRSSSARAWFDRGLIWAYAFNHEEAVACFDRAAAADPTFALAHWGIAYAAGPNYNKQWDAFEPDELRAALHRCRAAVARAIELADDAPAVERDLIAALATRYPAPGTADGSSSGPDDGGFPETLERRNSAYAEAMSAVYAGHGDDLDVAALYADALLNVTAWQLWDLPTGAPAPGAHTLQAADVLDAALALPGGMTHPGLLHFQIHLHEMSPSPEHALPAADALRELVPDAGHLLHMPTHIDVLLGDYARVITGNERAIAADDRYAAFADGDGFYTLYRAHDHHFRIYGAMLAGRQATALAAAADLEAALPEPLLRTAVPPMADWLESFVGMRVHALIRFGRFDELIAQPLPRDPELYCVTTALHRYGRGIALAARGRIADAEVERELLSAARAAVPESRTLFNNTALDILAVAAAMLDGEIAYRAGDYEAAWASLERAVALDDTLPYDEPWGWMQPTRHALGALLLEQGEVPRALSVYAADLGYDETLPRACRHPRNVWSLHGYHECLVTLGRTQEAAAVAPELARALAGADVTIESSCFCRLTTAASA